MANFILVSPSSGTGNITIKVKPTGKNTSTIVEKNGKLVIRVNGEIQKTIPLTQNMKDSTGGGGGGGTTTKTITSREISLDIYEGLYPDPSGSKCLTTNTGESKKSNQWYLRPSYTYDDTSNSTFKILLVYSISAIQTDYFSDGTQEYTNLLPKFKWQSGKDDTGTMKNWSYEYSGSPKATSETDQDVEVQSSDDTPVLAGYNLSVNSKVEMSQLPTMSKVYASFTVGSKHRTDVTDTLGPSTINVDIYWTITELKTTGLTLSSPSAPSN